MKSPNSSTSSFKLTGKFTLLLIALIFFLTVTTYAFNEVIRTPHDDDANGERKASVIQILMNSLKSNEDERSKLLLINVEQQNDTQKLLATILSAEEAKRKARAANESNATQALKLNSAADSNRDNRGYYEEQRAVVVHAEGATPILAQRQPPFGPPSAQEDSDERPMLPEEDGDEEEEQTYDEQQAGEEGDYTNESGYYQRGSGPYYPNARAQYGQEESDEQGDQQQPQPQQNEARSTQQRQYDAYYRQWHYATTVATPLAGNRKLQRVGDRNRDPYANYEEDPSDYGHPPSAPGRSPQTSQQQDYRPQQPRPQSQTSPTNALKARPTAAASAVPAEPTYLSVMKSLKTMWDIYQAFSTAWGAIAEHHQKQRDQQQEQLKLKRQQLSRINSKKPPKFVNDDKLPQKNRNNNTTKATKSRASTTTTTTTMTTITDASSSDSATTALPPAKNEPRKNAKGDAAARQAVSGLRMKRDESDAAEGVEPASTAVAEGRYIKGDPLKGYYDFVITEGSYKFWAVFQVGTALLIIYSTFAAIYYSKVNPLVSDYDYTDYLGGSRSLSGGDLDFVDDGEEGATATATASASKGAAAAQQQNWYDWGTRAGHSLKFILEAIDKLPGEEHVAYEAAAAAAEEEVQSAGADELAPQA